MGAVCALRLMRSLPWHPAESSRVRVRAFPLRLSASASGLGSHRHPPPPNNSFKPTPCRGVGHVLFALRLHVSAAPPRVGLTQALGGRKAFDCFARQCSFSRLRLALLFGKVVDALLLRSSPSGALTLRMRAVGRLRKRCLVAVSVLRLTRLLRLHPAESSQVRVRASPLRLSASAPGSDFNRRPPPPNNSFKPTPCRGVGHVLLRYACTCPPPRHGAA